MLEKNTLRKSLVVGSFLALLFLLIFSSSEVKAQSPGLCGQACGAGIGGCVAGLKCAILPRHITKGICINPAGSQCGPANTCCALLSVTPVINKLPTGTINISQGPDDTISRAPTSQFPSISPLPPVSGGDCASVQGPGVPDGKVDLLDVDQLRVEISQQKQTLFCDFDKNNTVDIFDFNTLRQAFVGQSKI
ncbi:hypothetical protein A3F34_03090 [Candidatus Roizmanbacteria bacterium RIFCSPHIGHO2_12_FULL_44_10]|uniref:EF-hand domain-containing protein n=1 Tax=Candidatus Roizmanbacteria bacterium RIFCSPHIGHO2_12_FULL_44_10 TaxID=1802054 RepID=A0A1F7I5U4_9BACT|nr:MAG: hypothetical protein A3F34_03090 [Candidatus Roizmanbacteria bacterium RIFCSPHIGHO2_12_FULL_44_10]